MNAAQEIVNESIINDKKSSEKLYDNNRNRDNLINIDNGISINKQQYTDEDLFNEYQKNEQLMPADGVQTSQSIDNDSNNHFDGEIPYGTVSMCELTSKLVFQSSV